jgi:hypothetical protein
VEHLRRNAVGVFGKHLARPRHSHQVAGRAFPQHEQQDLWCPGQHGYGCFKIPSLLRLPDSTRLLAFIEARKYSCSDEGYVDLLLKTSDDDGQTWSAPSLVHTGSTAADWHTIGDALPLLDRRTGIVHLIFTRDNQDVFHTSSAVAARPHQNMTGPQDWASPRNISSAAVVDRSHFVGTGHAQAGHAKYVKPKKRKYVKYSEPLPGNTWNYIRLEEASVAG